MNADPVDPHRPRRVLGVRLRILATVLVLAALGMALTAASALLVERNQVLAQADGALGVDVREFRAHVDAVEAGASPTDDVAEILRSALQRQTPMAGEAFLGLVDGRPAFVTSGSRPVALERETALVARVAAGAPTDPAVVGQADTAAGPVRYAAVRVRVAGRPQVGTYVAAVLLRPGFDHVAESARRYALLSAAALLLVGLGGWLVAGRLLRPLRLLREAAQRVSRDDLSARIPVTGRDDVTELTRTVNAMLDRLQMAFDTQQRFLDDAGHELRTPLTIVRGHLEVLDPGDHAEVEQTRGLVVDELDRMARLVNDLVLLAQAGRPDFLHLSLVDVDVLVSGVVEKARALGDREWVVDSTPGVVVVADPQRLTQALLQLAHNATRHTRPGDVVGVGARLGREGLRVWVRDTGPGVDPADAERIFERFGRAGPRGPVSLRGDHGSGLGLAIVRSIAVAHGGSVRLDHAGGPGASFSIVLPTAVVVPQIRSRPTAWTAPASAPSGGFATPQPAGTDR